MHQQVSVQLASSPAQQSWRRASCSKLGSSFLASRLALFPRGDTAHDETSPSHPDRDLPTAVQRHFHAFATRCRSWTISTSSGSATPTPRPICVPCPGSTHGYDVADPTRLNPEIGTPTRILGSGLARSRRAAWGTCSTWCPTTWASRKSANPWWMDVLENGPSSRYAQFFDITWRPLKDELADKVLIPTLGDQYGAVLDREGTAARLPRRRLHRLLLRRLVPDGARHVRPDSDARARRVAGGERARRSIASDADELRSIITAAEHLPSRSASDAESIADARPREGDRQAAPGGAGRTLPVAARTDHTPR